MSAEIRASTLLKSALGTAEGIEFKRQKALLKTGALQNAILNSANFSSIATDAKGVIQIFNVGAERMLGYTAADVMNKITPAEISDPQEVIARAKALSVELETPIAPGFEDIYELTYIRKDGSRFPAIVSVTALRDDEDTIIGYLLIGTDNTARKQAEEALLKAGALQSAIFNSANFSSIATDAKGVIQIFNVGAERMLGYTAADVMNKITPADISDPQEVIARAKELSAELETQIAPGFEALVFKASRGIEDIYELTYIRKDGSRFPAVVSVTALRDAQDAIIGYLLIGTDNTARKQIEAEKQRLLEIQEETNKQLQRTNLTLQVSEERLAVTLNSIGDAVIATDAEARVTLLNPLAEQLTGWTQAQATGHPVDEIFHIINQETRQPATIPVMETLAHGTIQGLANHTVLIARNGSECVIADSCAPIRDRDNQVIGAVLVFRDVTEEYAAQHTLRMQQVEMEMQNEELRASRAALDISKARYFDLYNMAPVGYCSLSEHGLIQEANLAAAILLDSPHEALNMQPISRFFFPEDADIYYLMRKRLTNTGKPQASELRIVKKDGTQIWVHLSITASQDDNLPVIRLIMSDISERKQIEAEQKLLDQRLRDQQFYTRSLIESNIDALMTSDPSGIITDVNKQMEVLTGCTRDELIGAPFKKHFTDPERAKKAINLALSEKKINNYELTARSREGNETVVSFNAATFHDRNGKLQGVFAAARDITERKHLEQILLEKNDELESAKYLAEKSNFAKSDFLSSMSHELRTPLNAILGFAQLLEAGSPPPTDAQIIRLHQIIKAGWYLLELINEILDLTVIESGNLSLSREPVSLINVVHECQSMIESQAQQRNIKLNFLPVDSTWFANADQTRVKQVLINLLSNAIKYNSERGSVEVSCTAPTPERIRVSVSDTGAGLPPAKLAQLFQPFNRLGQENGTEEGTGIGLMVTKRLVELMGGTIGVESTVGVGSVFWFELNSIAKPHLSMEEGNSTILPQSDRVPLHTLLYVEDNPANLMLVEHIIEDHPHVHMLSARDGNHGIALARTHLPDVILMDINLPGISGIEAMKILREYPPTTHIPIIALSANAMQRDIEKGLEAGFFRYLTKPIKINEFINALNDALKFSEIELGDTIKMDKYDDKRTRHS